MCDPDTPCEPISIASCPKIWLVGCSFIWHFRGLACEVISLFLKHFSIVCVHSEEVRIIGQKRYRGASLTSAYSLWVEGAPLFSSPFFTPSRHGVGIIAVWILLRVFYCLIGDLPCGFGMRGGLDVLMMTMINNRSR